MDRAHTKGRERPILFSAPMVRALLSGTKTQTRRILPGVFDENGREVTRLMCRTCGVGEREFKHDKCVCSKPVFEWTPCELAQHRVSDRLWVREAWRGEAIFDDTKPSAIAPDECNIRYEADGPWTDRDPMTHAGKLRPSMFMPRWASRLTLTVTDVRVQRLQEISEEDARAEGVECDSDGWRDYLMPATQCCATAKTSYLTLWDAINGAGSWGANPWCAAYTFTVERRNIDEGRANRADATPNHSPSQEG